MTTVSTLLRAQVAPFRTAPPGSAWTAAGVSAGPVQAAVIVGGDLQYLTQSPAGQTWYLQPFTTGASIAALEVVVALTPVGATFSGVTMVFATSDGVSSLVMDAGSGVWGPATTTWPDAPVLRGLGVAYTPITGASGNPGGNPVVYGQTALGDLWTAQWVPGTATWVSTTYHTLGDWYPGTGISLVSTSETTWMLFANGPGQGAAGVWAGEFGAPTSPSLIPLGLLAGDDAPYYIAGGAVSSGSAASNGSPIPCIIFVDDYLNLLMWPSTLSNGTVVQTPAGGLSQQSTGAPVATVVRGGGASVDLYAVDRDGDVYVLHQASWVFDNQLPFFAPPSLVTGPTTVDGATSTPASPIPDPLPTDAPAVCIADAKGVLSIWALNGGAGTFGGQFYTGQWSGGPVSATVATAPVVGVTASPQYAETGVSWSTPLLATGGFPPYTWAPGSGVPAWMSVSDGVLSGTPPEPGSYAPTVEVTDSAGTTATQSLTLTVVDPVTITTASTLPGAVSGVAYSTALAATGGQAPYTWSLVAGSTPPVGLTFSATGVLSGTWLESAGTTATFDVGVTESSPLALTATQTVSISLVLTITTTGPLPAAVAGVPYSEPLAASGGVAPYTWTLVETATVPPGLNLSAAGVLAGTWAPDGFWEPGEDATVAVEVTDSVGATATASLVLPLVGILQFTVGPSLPDATSGAPYVTEVTFGGGAGPYAWSLVSGSLPQGIEFFSGTIEGECESPPGALATFTLELSDGTGQSVTQTFTIQVTA